MNKNSDERIQKILSQCGIASRRKAEELILAGRIKVNGHPVKVGDKANVKKDRITLDGKRIVNPNKLVYIMLNKPRGYVSTLNDELDRKCVKDLVKDIGTRVYPIGRLDKDSEGLLLMTNDGEFNNLIIHPSRHVPKIYRVTVRQKVTEQMLAQFNIGIEIDGQKTAPADAEIIEQAENRTVLKITLYEGKNRQIRKMCEYLGLEVARLKRISIGTVKLGMLKPGKWRNLTDDEIRRLAAYSKQGTKKFR
ncbi:MAG: pseudouridine synthase [Clostridia bacterium]|nr:pseudouridine synthase [Clostridia bacterium]